MSSLPLANAMKVHASLTTSSPLYLGQDFAIHHDPKKRRHFSELISCINPKHPHYQQIQSTLQAIETWQNPPKFSCINKATTTTSPGLPQWQHIPRVATAVSPVLPQSQIFAAPSFQNTCGIHGSSFIHPVYGTSPVTTSYAPVIYQKPIGSGSASSSSTQMLNYAPLTSCPIPAPLNTASFSSSSQGAMATLSHPKPSRSSQVVDASSIYQIRYDQRVAQWFTDPSRALSTDKYRYLGPKVQKKVEWVHAFSRVVDAFIGSEYCLKGAWKDRYVLVFIPAEIEQNGQTTRGGFQYAFLPNGTCYHRAWGEKSNNDLIDQIANQTLWNQVDFPPFEENENKSPPPQEIVEEFESYDIDLDPQSGKITFMDGDIRITLFKVSDQI